MYSRSYGGIESDGDYGKQACYAPPKVQDPPAPACVESPGAVGGLFDKIKHTLSHLDTDDYILIAIGILLLLDSEEDNDIILVFIAALLFF